MTVSSVNNDGSREALLAFLNRKSLIRAVPVEIGRDSWQLLRVLGESIRLDEPVANEGERSDRHSRPKQNPLHEGAHADFFQC